VLLPRCFCWHALRFPTCAYATDPVYPPIVIEQGLSFYLATVNLVHVAIVNLVNFAVVNLVIFAIGNMVYLGIVSLVYFC
jgi:hypothetical protein